MKKSILMLGLAVAAMTSCTNDEVLEQSQSIQKAIRFESFVNKTTRAITTTNAPGGTTVDNITGLQKIYVYGYYNNDGTPVTEFDGWTVTRESVTENNVTSLSWEYEVPDGAKQPYWTANHYYFAAVAQGDNTENASDITFGAVTETVDDNTTTTEGVLKIENFTVAYENNNSITECNANDLVADIVDVEGSTGKTERVGFNFNHLLSKMKINIVNTSDDGSTVDITNVMINNLKYKGTFTAVRGNIATDFADNLTYENWEPTNDVYSNFIAYSAETGVTVNDELESAEFLVLPQDLSSLTVTFTATYRDENGSVVDEQDINLSLCVDGYESWKPQYAYVYQIGLPSNAKPIKFNVTGLTDWKNASAETIPLN